jgi:HEAT repeat protein
MEPISILVSYLISLAAGVRTEAILKKQTEKRQQKLAKIEKTQQIQSFKDYHALVGEMQSLGNQLVTETKQIADLPDEAKALIDLFAERDFLHELAQWLVMWDIEEGMKAQQVLESRMSTVLEKSGANPEYIDQIKNTYFALAAQEISRNPVLANWRHQLCLNALSKEVTQILQLAKKKAGQYSLEQRQQAFDHYRNLTLESCDILDLAGLPEDDRHLATQKFILRQFYVPLRLNVEMARDAEISLEKLEQLESRREKQRLYAAGRFGNLSQGTDLKRVSVGERIDAAQRLVVLGDPGAGKTTLIRWLVTAYLLKMKADPDFAELPDVATLPDKAWLPVLIRCRELDESCFTGALDDILRQTLRRAQMTEQEADILLAVLREQLADGKALLLLDGLDEITDATTRARFCRQIESIGVAYPLVPIITTSRIVGYREMPFRLGRGFEQATVTELSKEDKDEFARRWCTATEPEERQKKTANDLIHAIHSSDRIERLSGNPMLLTTLALVKRKVGKLPNRRADLYYEAVQVLLNWRSEVDDPIDRREAIPQLEYVAYEMCRRGVQRLREDEILELLDNVRKDYPNIRPIKKHNAEEFLHLLERRTSILVEAGTVRHNGMPVPVFEFRHLTFQEYLAGLALVEGRFPNRDKSLSLPERIAALAGQTELKFSPFFGKKEHTVSENWREALRLCISCCNDDDVDEALNAIVTPLGNEDAAITARPRAILAGSCLADEPNVSEEMALEVLQKLVGQVQDRDGSDEVDTSLDAVAIEFARSEWAERLQVLLVAEFCQRDAKNRSNFGGLCAIIGETLVPYEPDLLTQWFDNAIVELNSNNEEAKAIEKALTILAVAFNDFSGREGLSESMGFKLVHALINMLGRAAHVAHAAAWTLNWVVKGNSKKYGNTTYYCPDYDGSGWILLAEENLVQILDILSIPNFDSEVTVILILILSDANYSPAVEPLIAKLDDDDFEVRKTAIEALGEIKDSRAVEPLIAKLDDKEVGSAVAYALGKIKDSRAVEPLIAKLDDKEVGIVAAEALGKIKDSRAVEPLIAKLDDDDSNVRSQALGALAKICRDEVDQKLLSVFLTGDFAWHDPKEPISERQVAKAASELKLTPEEVRQRYEALARAFNLTLAWQSQ